MVYGTENSLKNKIHTDPSEPVNIMDRVFSVLIDYFILSPFVSLILWSLFKDAMTFYRRFPEAPEATSTLILIVICTLGSFSLLQALLIAYAGATPGQYYLKIRFQFYHDRSLILWRAFLRQMGFSLSLFMLGLPWLTVLFHPHKQAFYDRLADGRLLSLKKGNQYLFFENEPVYWKSFYSTALIFVFAFLVILFSYKRHQITFRVASYNQNKSQQVLCEEITGVSEAQRLPFAVAMVFAQQVDTDCLDREADFVLWKQIAPLMPLAYFAKVIVSDRELKLLSTQLENSRQSNIESHPLFKDLTKKLNQYSKLSCEDEKNLSCHLNKAYTENDLTLISDDILNENESLLADVLKFERDRHLNNPDSSKELEKYSSNKLVKKYLIQNYIEKSEQEANASRGLASEKKDSPSWKKWLNDL